MKLVPREIAFKKITICKDKIIKYYFARFRAHDRLDYNNLLNRIVFGTF